MLVLYIFVKHKVVNSIPKCRIDKNSSRVYNYILEIQGKGRVMILNNLEYSKEVEEIIQIKIGRLRDPRREKLRDYRSGGHRKWPSMSGRYLRTGAQNFIQKEMNRKARYIPIVDQDGEGVIPANPRTVDWLVW
jgi:hypothetical protein